MNSKSKSQVTLKSFFLIASEGWGHSLLSRGRLCVLEGIFLVSYTGILRVLKLVDFPSRALHSYDGFYSRYVLRMRSSDGIFRIFAVYTKRS